MRPKRKPHPLRPPLVVKFPLWTQEKEPISWVHRGMTYRAARLESAREFADRNGYRGIKVQ